MLTKIYHFETAQLTLLEAEPFLDGLNGREERWTVPSQSLQISFSVALASFISLLIGLK